MIRAVLDKDANSIVDTYNHYIAKTIVTFEEETVTAANILSRIIKVKANNLPWLVAEDESGKVMGYAYASKWRERFYYRFSVEVTVYLSPEHANKGIGSKLYAALFS